MEFSSLIGKPVLSPAGENYGYVKCAYLSKTLSSLAGLLCVDSEEEEFFLPASAIRAIGDALIVEDVRLESPIGIPCPVGRAVYDEFGSFLGAASALTDGPCGTLTVVGAIGSRDFPVKSVQAGENVIIFYGKKKLSKPQSPDKSTAREPQQDKSTARTPQQDKSNAKPPQPPKKSAYGMEKSDERMIAAYRTNLLGRRVRRTVEGLACEGEKVTAEMLQRAHESNRILELTAGVLTQL